MANISVSCNFPKQTVPVSTVAGSGVAASSNGIGPLATFNLACGVAVSHSGIFAVVTERSGHRVRIIDMITSQDSTLAGSGNGTFADGQGTWASFSAPEGVAISPDDSFVIVGEGYSTTSHRVRHIAIATGVVTTVAGNGAGYADGVGTFAKFHSPQGIAISPDGTFVLIIDGGNNRVRRLDMASKAVTTVAGSIYGHGDGRGTHAQFKSMFQLAIDRTGTYALICDVGNDRIRRLEIASLQVTTLAGSGATGFEDNFGTSAIFNKPYGVSIDPTGTYALIAEYGNHRIRRIVVATAQVSTLAGSGTISAVDGAGAQATFSFPLAISIHVSGQFALVSDVHNYRIRHIALTSPPCNVGFYCPAGSSSPTQASCGAGQFCAAVTGLSAPTLCAPGYFCAGGSVFTVRGAVDGQGNGQLLFYVFVPHPILTLLFHVHIFSSQSISSCEHTGRKWKCWVLKRHWYTGNV